MLKKKQQTIFKSAKVFFALAASILFASMGLDVKSALAHEPMELQRVFTMAEPLQSIDSQSKNVYYDDDDDDRYDDDRHDDDDDRYDDDRHDDDDDDRSRSYRRSRAYSR